MSGPRHHTLDIYNAELHLATDRRQWATLRRSLTFLDREAPDSAGFAQFVTFQPKDGTTTVPHLVLWIDVKRHRTRLELIDSCAHEASHAAGQLLNYIGHECRGMDEPLAYLVGWLTQWMAEAAGLD